MEGKLTYLKTLSPAATEKLFHSMLNMNDIYIAVD
jgi:hypothetical protein